MGDVHRGKEAEVRRPAMRRKWFLPEKTPDPFYPFLILLFLPHGHWAWARRDNETMYDADRAAIIGSAASIPGTTDPGIKRSFFSAP